MLIFNTLTVDIASNLLLGDSTSSQSVFKRFFPTPPHIQSQTPLDIDDTRSARILTGPDFRQKLKEKESLKQQKLDEKERRKQEREKKKIENEAKKKLKKTLQKNCEKGKHALYKYVLLRYSEFTM